MIQVTTWIVSGCRLNREDALPARPTQTGRREIRFVSRRGTLCSRAGHARFGLPRAPRSIRAGP